MARPRVFVSSTFYDLKHIRNELKKFIENYGFEPILNEAGSIPFSHLQPLDESCFQEAQQCNIFVLIIGGRYGSSASDQDYDYKTDEQEEFYNRYISITRKEYRSAFEKNIPIYIFVDRNVYTEYRTFIRNKDNGSVKYAWADHVEIFNFIEEATSKLTNNSLCPFERFDDISSWLKEQWSGLFHNYLIELQNRSQNQIIVNSVTKLDTITENIYEMLNKVSKNILDDNDEYQVLTKTHTKRLLEYYGERLVDSIGINLKETSADINEVKISDFVHILFEEYLENKYFEDVYKVHKSLLLKKDASYYKDAVKLRETAKNKLKEVMIEIDKITFNKTLHLYYSEIRPIFERDVDLAKEFREIVLRAFYLKFFED